MRKLIFSICAILSCSAFAFAQGTSPKTASDSEVVIYPKALNFMVIGDWGRVGEFNQKELAVTMGKVADKVEPEFIISTGDNFYPDGVASTSDIHWKRSFEEVYTSYSLMCNWHVVLGNHDYRGNVQAQIDYSNISRRWNMPSRYFAFEETLKSKQKVAFIFVDTNPFETKYYTEKNYKNAVTGQDTTKQKMWLDSVLTAHKDTKLKVVIGHHPLYSGGKRLEETKNIARAFQPVFEKHKVSVYFAGHEHDLQVLKPTSGNTIHFVSGAGSEIRPTGKQPFSLFAESQHGFMVVSVLDDKMIVQVVNLDGKVLYRYNVAF